MNSVFTHAERDNETHVASTGQFKEVLDTLK